MKIKKVLGGIFPTLIFNFRAFGILNAFMMKFPIFIGGGGNGWKNFERYDFILRNIN